MQGEALDSLGVRYGTDKASRGHPVRNHDYLNFYERFLAPLREEAVSILEIGVWAGASLSMWADYFPNARTVGLDKEPKIASHPNPRGTIEIADQSDVGDLLRIAGAYGPFDLIVDDGSHYWDHQITSLRYLLPFVKPGRYYILEDIITSYGTYIEAHRGISKISGAEYLKKLCDYMIADAALDIDQEQDPFIRSYARRCEFICFSRQTSVIRLRP